MQTSPKKAVRRRRVRRILCSAVRTFLLTLYTFISVPAVSEASPITEENALPTVWFSEKDLPRPWIDPRSSVQKPLVMEESATPNSVPTDDLCRAMCATRAYTSYPYFYRNPLYGGGLAPRFPQASGGHLLLGGLARPAVPPVTLYPPVRPYGYRRSAILVAPHPPGAPLFAPVFGLQRTIVPPAPPLYIPYGLRLGQEIVN